jgi:hypothetical protein
MITLPRRIVLCGVSKSGKSTLGWNFERRFGHVPVAFADPLKKAAHEIFGFDSDHLWGPSHTRETRYDEFEFSGWCFECQQQMEGPERHLSLFELDDEEKIRVVALKHHDDNNYWLCPSCGAEAPKSVTVREALKTMGTAWGRKYCKDLWSISCFAKMRPNKSYVVTDCRFDNERHNSWKRGACVVLLKRGLAESTSPHPSEAEVRFMAETPDLFHVVLDNTEGEPEENFNKLIEQLVTLSRDGRMTSPALMGIEWHRHEDGAVGLK